MKTKPELKAGDRVLHIGESQKRGVVSRVFQFADEWWLEFEGEPNWRYAPRHFDRVASGEKSAAPEESDAGWQRL
jgi:hypothetical protein